MTPALETGQSGAGAALGDVPTHSIATPWSVTVPNRLTDVAALTTLAIGTGLTIAPGATGTALGLGDRRVSRTIGLFDLALGTCMLRGRPRWPWMAARTAFHQVIAACYALETTRPDPNPRARSGLFAMATLTVLDGATAAALRSSERIRTRHPPRAAPGRPGGDRPDSQPA